MLWIATVLELTKDKGPECPAVRLLLVTSTDVFDRSKPFQGSWKIAGPIRALFSSK